MLALLLWLRRLVALHAALRKLIALLGFVLLIVLQWVGGWLMNLVHAPIPGSVAGMVLLAAGIQLRIIPRGLVRASAELLVRHLTLLYVPAGVGVLLYVALLRREWLPITGGALVSLIAVLATVGVVADRLERHPPGTVETELEPVEPVLVEEP